MTKLSRLSNLLLDLHRSSGSSDAAEFQSWALRRLRAEIEFDSAIWVSAAATASGADMHGIHLENQPVQMLVDYEDCKRYDTFFAQVMKRPGVSIRSDARQAPREMWPYLRRYGLMQGMATVEVDPTTALVTVVSLYRRSRQRPFSAVDAGFMQSAFPHLAEADRRCKLMHLRQVAEATRRAHGRGGFASCDTKGLLRHADHAFEEAVLADWPDWRGPWLPEPLRVLVQAPCDETAVGHSIIARSTPLGELWLLHLRRRRPVEALPKRLREVAELAARGLSHKDIGAQLGIAPATVRNNLSTLFARLRVSSKAGLAARLGDSGSAPL